MADFISFKDSYFIIKKDEIKHLGIIYESKQIDIKTGLEKPNFYKIVINKKFVINCVRRKPDELALRMNTYKLKPTENYI